MDTRPPEFCKVCSQSKEYSVSDTTINDMIIAHDKEGHLYKTHTQHKKMYDVIIGNNLL